MNGPTMRRLAEGKARRTEKPPRSEVRGTIIVSIGSQLVATPGIGSGLFNQLIGFSLPINARLKPKLGLRGECVH